MRTAHSVATTRCQYQWGGGGVGPWVNKFEQVSSDDHLVSVAEGRGDAQVMSGGGWGVSP